MGVLYIVATPIGNLKDITLRAIEVLKSVDLIAAEDTRTSGILLEKYEIKTPLESYHKFNETIKSEDLIEKLIQGQNIALITDAGTPLISDPGNKIVELAIKNGIKTVPVGGISAPITFLSSVSREGEDFKFIGFLPRVKARIEEIIFNNANENLIFYESKERIEKVFEIILNIFPNAKISIGRELTKKFEEIKTDNIKNIIEHFKINPPRGEFVCMIHKNNVSYNELLLKKKINLLKEKNFSQKDISIILEITDNVKKNKVKELFLND